MTELKHYLAPKVKHEHRDREVTPADFATVAVCATLCEHSQQLSVACWDSGKQTDVWKLWEGFEFACH